MSSTVSPVRSVPAPELAEFGLPDSSITVSPEMVMLSDPAGGAAESMRHLRTRIIAQHLDRGRRVLAVCSAARQTGCSFIAANLAIACAQADIRVLLVNGDMREPGLDQFFGGLPDAGLMQYLASRKMRPDEVTEAEIVPNLWLTPSGGIPSDAQELLSTHRFESFVNVSMRQFDLLIIDTPPANQFADAQRIAAVAGYAILVGRKNKTYTHDLAELSRQMTSDGVCLVGTVLNDY
jgi:protein-tyrosine kinase